ncbi:MAG: hypothetical protein LAN64_12430 [Acidobacteriia bacterium]|nr:hypothetical protein [Terriglobia bacterium]
MKLRPVALYYKAELDETQTRQYGVVAEEVTQVAPHHPRHESRSSTCGTKLHSAVPPPAGTHLRTPKWTRNSKGAAPAAPTEAETRN